MFSMAHKPVRSWEPLILAAMGAGLLLMTVHPIRAQVLSFLSASTPWKDHDDGLALICLCYGLALLALAVWSVLMSVKGASLRHRIVPLLAPRVRGLKAKAFSLASLPATRPGDPAGLAVALAIGLGVRAYFLSLPLRYDECRTFLRFVERASKDLFIYTEPNNHVLHTLSVKLSTLVWGSHPVSLRIPALLAALASIVLVYRVARAMDAKAGLPSALAAAVFPYLVLFGSIARGYSLLTALMLALVLVGFGYIRNPAPGKTVLFAALSALGLFTMPSMLFAVAGLLVWVVAVLGVEKRPLADIFRGFLVPCALWTTAFTFILYTPVIIASNGVRTILSNRFVTPQPFMEFVHAVPRHLQRTYADFTRDIPAAAVVSGLVLILLGLGFSIQKKRWAAALLLPSLIFGSLAVLVLNHRIPFPRTWIFLIPVALVTADLGLRGLVERLPPAGTTLVQAVLVVAASAYAFHLMAVDAVGRYPDVGTFPEAPAVVEFLKPRVRPGDRVMASVPADEVMKYYLWYNGVVHDRRVKEKNIPRERYLVIKPSRYGTSKLTGKPVKKLLSLGDAEVYQVVRD